MMNRSLHTVPRLVTFLVFLGRSSLIVESASSFDSCSDNALCYAMQNFAEFYLFEQRAVYVSFPSVLEK